MVLMHAERLAVAVAVLSCSEVLMHSQCLPRL